MPSNLQFLREKVCVIAGVSSERGIGYATAALFAQHGAKLALLDIEIDDARGARIADEIEADSGIRPDILTLQTDVTSQDSCDAAIQATCERFGTIDSLVSTVGMVSAKGFLSISSDDFDRMIDVNLKGTFNLCRSAIPVFIEKQAGSIVTLSSSAAQRGGGFVGGPHYAASKGGVISLTRTIAREFGPKGLRANVICPAMIDTAMLDGLEPDRRAAIIDTIPLRKLGTPLDVANACLFLASDMSGFITGATIDVNGGAHIH